LTKVAGPKPSRWRRTRPTASKAAAAKVQAAWSGEQVAATIGGGNKADIEQILDSLAAPLQPPGTSSGSSGSSDGLDSWAFSSDGHTGRLGYPCRRPSDHARGDSPSETDSCRTVRTVRTVVPPVWLDVFADLRETLGQHATWQWPRAAWIRSATARPLPAKRASRRIPTPPRVVVGNDGLAGRSCKEATGSFSRPAWRSPCSRTPLPDVQATTGVRRSGVGR
jgi:hypothetical protein